jgi:hypothetical protein
MHTQSSVHAANTRLALEAQDFSPDLVEISQTRTHPQCSIEQVIRAAVV